MQRAVKSLRHLTARLGPCQNPGLCETHLKSRVSGTGLNVAMMCLACQIDYWLTRLSGPCLACQEKAAQISTLQLLVQAAREQAETMEQRATASEQSRDDERARCQATYAAQAEARADLTAKLAAAEQARDEALKRVAELEAFDPNQRVVVEPQTVLGYRRRGVPVAATMRVEQDADEPISCECPGGDGPCPLTVEACDQRVANQRAGLPPEGAPQ